jgi:DNA-binding transcriptional ArsR family regulator
MQTVHLTRADLTKTRLATASMPLLDSSLALAEYRVTGRHRGPGPVDGPRQLALRAAARPLLDLTFGPVGPVFLDPLVGELDEGLELLRATPRSVIKSELHRVMAGRTKPVPTWVRNLADGDRDERKIIETAVRACYDLFVAQHHVEYNRAFARDVAARTAVMRTTGSIAVLADLHPQLRFHDSTLRMPHQRNQARQMEGQGLELVPSAVWSGAPMLSLAWNQPGRTLLIYPIALDNIITPIRGADAVARLIGTNRAEVLQQLSQPTTTGDLAIRLGLSAASVSQHATVLRDSGLIASKRSGRTVHHVLTPLGEAMLAGRAVVPAQEPARLP